MKDFRVIVLERGGETFLQKWAASDVAVIYAPYQDVQSFVAEYQRRYGYPRINSVVRVHLK